MPEDRKMYRDIGLNDPVTVTLPAHVWVSFTASYSNSDWSCGYANQIANAAQKVILDPVFVSEKEAEFSAAHDQHQKFLSNFLPGIQPPQVPPDLSGLQDGDQQ